MRIIEINATNTSPMIVPEPMIQNKVAKRTTTQQLATRRRILPMDVDLPAIVIVLTPI
jgi:hypothetical protein